MIEQRVRLNNEFGLHARPASILVEQAQKYKAEIKLSKGNSEANMKSILGLVCLRVKDGDEILIKAEGDDEEKAIDRFSELIEGRLKLLAYKQDKKAVAEEIVKECDGEPSKSTIPNPSQVLNTIGRGVKKTMKSLGLDID